MKIIIKTMLPDVMMIVLGFTFVFVFLWNNLFHGAVNFTPTVGTNDYMDMNVPYRKFYNETILKGKIPVWSSEVSSGYPIMASSELGSLNPLNLLMVKFNPYLSYAVSLLMTYCMIFIFSYLYFRQLKISPPAGLLGGIIASFSGYAANQIMHFGWLNAYAYFLGELLFIEKYLRTRKFIFILFAGLMLGLSCLGGHPQIVIYSQLVIYPYWFIRWMLGGGKVEQMGNEEMKKLEKGDGKVKNMTDEANRTNKTYKETLVFLSGILLYTLFGLGIGAGQLLPTYELTINSTRSGGLNEASLSLYGMNFRDFYTFIKPFAFYSNEANIDGFAANGWPTDEKYIYTGIIPILLALTGLYLARKNVFAVLFFGIFVFSWLVSLGNKTVFVALLKIPPLSFFRIPYRISFLMALSVAVLAGIGMSKISEMVSERYVKYGNIRKIIYFTIVVVSAVVFFDLRIHAKKLYPEVDGKDWYKEPQAVAFIKDNLKDQERVTEEAYFDMSFPYYVNDHSLWEDPKMHKNLRNALPIFNNLLYSIPKNTPAANSGGLKVARYNELESEIFFDGFDYKQDGSIGVTDSFLFLNRIMGVRYILSNKQFSSFVTSLVKKIDLGSDQAPIYIYEFFDYFPRQFMVPHAEKETPEKIKEHLFKADFEPLYKIFVEEDVNWGAQGGFSANSHFEKYEDTEVVIKTQASGDGFLFLSDTYYPGWRAWVDGNETQILRANYAFRAVKVPAGEHEVIFRYKPESLKWGLRITVGTGIVLLMLIMGLVVGERKFRIFNF